MVILSYSGRGGGSRGGSDGGRGRGRGRSNNDRGGSGRGRGRFGGRGDAGSSHGRQHYQSNTWYNNNSSYSSTTRSHQWVRSSTNENSTAETDEHKVSDSTVQETNIGDDTMTASEATEPTTTTTAAAQIVSSNHNAASSSSGNNIEPRKQESSKKNVVMTKMGRNRLVLSSSSTTTSSTTATKGSLARPDDSAVSVGQLVPGKEGDELGDDRRGQTMMKNGGNKLIAAHLAVEQTASGNVSSGNHYQSVLNQQQHHQQHRRTAKRKITTNTMSKHRKPRPPVAKRIKLTGGQQNSNPSDANHELSRSDDDNDSQSYDGDDLLDTLEDDHDEQGTKVQTDLSKSDDNKNDLIDEATAKPVEETSEPRSQQRKTQDKTMSDFAYRQTSRVRQRPTSNHLQWTKKNDVNKETSESTVASSGKGDSTSTDTRTAPTSTSRRGQLRNMGLVRVKDDTSTVPICPPFLRGLPCEDPYCRKRHDIPKEFAMPVCSFFQRHGQCLRQATGTCPFRHIKVNPRATICPTFAVLGYCQDTECTMQHIRKTNSGPSTTSVAGSKVQSRSKKSYNNYKYIRKDHKS